ncbi:hypothetical protein J27TS7_54240 [Paenibacillus dendritiformis]|nr:hypothetical protein J27TS7_54240 [Paenibacillus dendritiformis]
MAGIENDINCQSMGAFYDRTLDIHTILLTTYPPMTLVLALTFLRSVSQEVDAVSRSFTGSLPL